MQIENQLTRNIDCACGLIFSPYHHIIYECIPDLYRVNEYLYIIYLNNIPITSNLTMSTRYPRTRLVTAELQPSANYGVFVRQTNGRTNYFLITLLLGTGHAPKAATARLHLHNRGLPIGRQIAVRRSIYELKMYKRNRPRRICNGGKHIYT